MKQTMSASYYQQGWTNEENLRRELIEGEQILWTGRPLASNKSSITPTVNAYRILTAVFLSVGILLATIGFILQMSMALWKATIPLYIVGGTFFFLAIVFGFFSLFGPFIPKKTSYAITDRRIIIIQSGQKHRVDSFSLADIGQIRSVENPDGSGDIIIAVRTGMSNYIYPGQDSLSSWSSLTSQQIVLQSISNVKDVEKKIISVFK